MVIKTECVVQKQIVLVVFRMPLGMYVWMWLSTDVPISSEQLSLMLLFWVIGNSDVFQVNDVTNVHKLSTLHLWNVTKTKIRNVTKTEITSLDSCEWII